MDLETREEFVRRFQSDPQYTAIDLANIHRMPTIHYVWHGEPYASLVGDARFELLIASHVAEHVPDLVSFIRQAASVLVPGSGVLRLAVPDHRYVMDFRRRHSTVAEVIAAYLEQRTVPPAQAVYETTVNWAGTMYTAEDHWVGTTPRAAEYDFLSPEVMQKHANALQTAARVVSSGNKEYIDVHCWTFTPESFTYIMRFLTATKLIPLRIGEVVPTAPGSDEFFVDLVQQGGNIDGGA